MVGKIKIVRQPYKMLKHKTTLRRNANRLSSMLIRTQTNQNACIICVQGFNCITVYYIAIY